MLLAKTVSHSKELRQILDLQQLYLRGKSDRQKEHRHGFLTVEHTLAILKQMHRLEPSIIVTHQGQLAGYALAMSTLCRDQIPVLRPMFTSLDELRYRNKPVMDQPFYVMGQICVAEAWRGQGVFDLLYSKHREVFAGRYEFVITEISTSNSRSLRAHERVGFTTIHVHRDAVDQWAIVAWDWC
jgi:hypothetical protein